MCKIKFVVFASFVLHAVDVSTQPAFEAMKIIPDDQEIKAEFGYDIGLDSDLIVVGAWQQGDGQSTVPNTYTPRADGAAYVFDVTSGEQLLRLIPNGLAPSDRFGVSVAISGDRVAVGAYGVDSGVFGEPGFASRMGAAYIFDSATGEERLKVMAADGAAQDWFGRTLDLDGDRLVVGALYADAVGEDSGAAYVFDAQTGEQIFKLVASDGAAGDQFGWEVVIEEDVIAVGARYATDADGARTGGVYIFDATTGEQLHKIEPPVGGLTNDSFGIALDIEGDVLAVGAPYDRTIGFEAGAAYLYSVSSGELLYELTPTDHQPDEIFGRCVAISNGLVAVGLRSSDDNNLHAGAIHLFDAQTGEQIRKLLPSDGHMGQAFGWRAAGSNGLFAITAPHDNPGDVLESGSAYIFDLSCAADLTHDGLLNNDDFLGWLAAFQSGTSGCDQNRDGMCTPADFSAWVANYNSCVGN